MQRGRGVFGRQDRNPDANRDPLSALIELQAKSAQCHRELLEFQSSLASRFPSRYEFLESLHWALSGSSELLVDLGVIAVALRWENPPEFVLDVREARAYWSEFEGGKFFCDEIVGPESLDPSEGHQVHEIVFDGEVPPGCCSLVFLTRREIEAELHEYVRFGRRELGRAVELWLSGVEERRRRDQRLDALEKLGGLERAVVRALNFDVFSTGSFSTDLIAQSISTAHEYLAEIRCGWDLETVECFGLPKGQPAVLGRTGREELWLEQPPAVVLSQDLPSYASPHASDGALDVEDGRFVRTSFPFNFRNHVGWGMLTVVSVGPLPSGDLVSLTSVAQGVGSIVESVFFINSQLKSSFIDLKSDRPNEAAMNASLQQLRSEGRPYALVLLGVVDRLKYFESFDARTLADFFATTIDNIYSEMKGHSGRVLAGIVTGSILYLVCESSFEEQATRDELVARLRRATSRSRLIASEPRVEMQFALGAVEASATANISQVLGAGYSALHEATHSDSSNVTWVVSESPGAAGTRLQRELELKRALETDQMVSFFQPEYSLRDGSLLSFESLARWEHPERGLLGPGEFIPLAERSGLITESDLQRLRYSAATAVSWGLAASGPEMRVNLSAATLHIEGLASRILEICDAEGLSYRQLVIEVTETAVLRNRKVAQSELATLRAAGVGVALDDFGAGESSLARLKSIPASIVKLDRQFVAALPGGRSDRAFIRAIQMLASAVDLELTAEGIETVAQRDCLLEAGVERGQGFLFSKPVAAPAARQLLEGARNYRTTIPHG